MFNLEEPSPSEDTITVHADEIDCPMLEGSAEVDAWSWDGETWLFNCPTDETHEHSVHRDFDFGY